MYIKSVIFGVSATFILLYLIPKLLSWIFRFKENKLLLKIKKELKQGSANALFYPYGPPCCTRCDFYFSDGRFSTTLDPASVHPFAHWGTPHWDVNHTEGLNTRWISKKMHSWYQRNKDKLS